MTTIAQMMDALATGIQTHLCGTANPVIRDLQVDGRLIPSPTPPAVDIYPGEPPFTEQISFGPGNREYHFTVRVRVGTADNEAGQNLLLSMMDDESAESMETALYTVTGVKTVEGPTGYGVFSDVGAQPISLIGCTWRVGMIP